MPGLWTGLDRGLDSRLDRGLSAIQTLIYRFHYNITYLADLQSLLIQDVPHLNNIYVKCLMKSFHGADVDDDSDRFYLASQ